MPPPHGSHGTERVQRDSAKNNQPTTGGAASADAGARGGDLKRQAAAAGDVTAQEDALKPGGGLLTPGKVDDALAYNGKRAKGQGEGWIKGLQNLVGAPPSGAYDEPTVQGVAGRQDDGGLRVDGKVGPKTEKDFVAQIAVVAAPDATGDAKQAAGTNAKAPVPEGVAPVDAKAADAKATDTPTTEPPKPAAKDEDKAAAEAAPPDVQALIARLDGALMPITSQDKDKLSLGSLPSWTDGRAKVLAEALAVFATLPAGADKTALGKALGDAAAFAAAMLSRLGKAVRDHAIQLVNDASVLKDPAKQPTLPSRADVGTYQAALRALGGAAANTTLAASGLQDAVTVAQDGALAIFQGLSVLSARATWKKGVVEPGAAGIAAANKDPDNALKGIFNDADWGDISAVTVKKDDGTESKKVADWCGMFVGASLYRGGGLDEELRKGFLHTSNVLDFFNYTQKVNAARAPRSVWADGEWHDLKTYHASRGAPRMWTGRAAVTATMEGDGALDVRPGDVVLIDHWGNRKAPQHITMVESYDPKTKILATIEGNTSGIQAPDGKVTDAEGGEHWKAHRGPDGSGVNTRDMTNMSKASRAANKEQHEANKAADAAGPRGSYTGKKGSTVFGIGRPSVCDFEEHSYATAAVPADMKKISPEEMRAMAAKKGKAGAKARKVEAHKSE